MRPYFVLGLLLLAPFVGRSDGAAIIALQQQRSVSATAYVQRAAYPAVNDSEYFSAPDFLPFNKTATAAASVPYAQAEGTGSQNSQISDMVVQATGTVSWGTYVQSNPQGGVTAASAASHFMLKFMLEEPATLELSGSVTSETLYRNAPVTVTLTGDHGTLVSVAIGAIEQPSSLPPFDNVLDLAAGQYTLTATADSNGGGYAAGASARYSLALQIVPEPLASLGVGIMAIVTKLLRPRRDARYRQSTDRFPVP